MQAKISLKPVNPLRIFPLNQYINNLSLDINTKSEAVILMDKQGNIEYINHVFCEDSGFKLEKGKCLNFREIVSEKITQNTLLRLWNTILSGKEWKDILHFKKRNGDVEVSMTTISPIYNKSGGITHFIITKNVSTENAEQGQKINNLIKYSYFGNIFCSLMHELKSHFALIKMNFNLLQPKSVEEINICSIIGRDLERINKLFSNFSQLSKDKELELIDLNVRDVIDYSYTSVEPLLRDKKISFINNVEPLIIKGDYQKLKCLFKNLLNNSIDAIEENGEIKIWSKKANDYHLIYFKDNGSGIKNYDKIFEPFYTTKSNGTGLGLAIVKKIIEEHNGVINLIKSKKGETIFEIKYPL
ncbi:MAG: HAMP domain-containing sensor histidine kinase [Ignavibacteriaceae bacterium]|nr:HAMP domain-containing sensor histidine kinase [Ignavibacteriaceae bacterium]